MTLFPFNVKGCPTGGVAMSRAAATPSLRATPSNEGEFSQNLIRIQTYIKPETTPEREP
jgi:hypothetical protein